MDKEKSGFSMAKAGISLFSIIIILIIILLTVRSCSVRKKEEVSNPPSSEIVSNSELGNSEVEEKVKEPSNKKDEKIESEVGIENKEKDKDIEKEGTSNSDTGFVKIEGVDLGESLEADMLVSGKSIYKVGESSIAYSIDLVVPLEEGYSVVKYFCPKKTYDALKSGGSVKATYQVDKNGLISITSLSK